MAGATQPTIIIFNCTASGLSNSALHEQSQRRCLLLFKMGIDRGYRTTIRAVGMERSLRIMGIQELDARKTEYSVSECILGIRYCRSIYNSRILQGHQAREHKPQHKWQQHRSRNSITGHHARGFHHRLSFQPIASP